MDAKPQLNTSCVIQAFPGKRTLLLSASRQKKKAKQESWAGAEAESRGFMPLCHLSADPGAAAGRLAGRLSSPGAELESTASVRERG